MGTTGLSKPRLERMHQVLSGFIDRKEMPGLVALVSHHDDVHVETLCRNLDAARRAARAIDRLGLGRVRVVTCGPLS